MDLHLSLGGMFFPRKKGGWFSQEEISQNEKNVKSQNRKNVKGTHDLRTLCLWFQFHQFDEVSSITWVIKLIVFLTRRLTDNDIKW